MTFNDCDVKCGSYFVLFHNVNGVPEEVGTMTVNGGIITCKKELAGTYTAADFDINN